MDATIFIWLCQLANNFIQPIYPHCNITSMINKVNVFNYNLNGKEQGGIITTKSRFSPTMETPKRRRH